MFQDHDCIRGSDVVLEYTSEFLPAVGTNVMPNYGAVEAAAWFEPGRPRWLTWLPGTKATRNAAVFNCWLL
jgi:hypothetical protein